MVMAEKTGLCLQMDGPNSSYAARVWHTLLNSGVDASIDPPNHTAKRCMWCEMTFTSVGVGLMRPLDSCSAFLDRSSTHLARYSRARAELEPS